MAATESEGKRDHLFVNYAYEDEALAGWLALKLTNAGYYVWFDQRKLLGGEPFPVDIDLAIKDRTFRMLSLLSPASVNKANPRKERQLAFNVGQSLGIRDFVIPLKATADLRPEKLNWEVSDLTWIDFSSNWADGFHRLLRKLREIHTPLDETGGPARAARWFTHPARVLSNQPEQVMANLVDLYETPEVVFRLHPAGAPALSWPANWPHVTDGLNTWVLEIPESMAPETVAEAFRWQDVGGPDGVLVRRQVSNLLRQNVLARAEALGLQRRPDGSAFFPFGLLDRNRWTFQGYKEKSTYKQLAADRSFSIGNGRRVKFRLLQAFKPYIDLRALRGHPSIRFGLEIYLTHPNGVALDDRQAHSFRRRLSRNWFNEEWLNRLLAVVSFLADGRESINLAQGPDQRIILAGRPVLLNAPHGINEAALGKEQLIELDRTTDDEITA